MPYGRNMNDAVLLPNGQIIIVNGAKVRAWSAQNPRGSSDSLTDHDECARALCLQFRAFHCSALVCFGHFSGSL
jgi:hypothetical protein